LTRGITRLRNVSSASSIVLVGSSAARMASLAALMAASVPAIVLSSAASFSGVAAVAVFPSNIQTLRSAGIRLVAFMTSSNAVSDRAAASRLSRSAHPLQATTMAKATANRLVIRLPARTRHRKLTPPLSRVTDEPWGDVESSDIDCTKRIHDRPVARGLKKLCHV